MDTNTSYQKGRGTQKYGATSTPNCRSFHDTRAADISSAPLRGRLMVDNDHCRVYMLPNVEKQFCIHAERDGGLVLSSPFDKDNTAVFVY